MPAGKLRGAAREYLQVLALKALYGIKGSESLLFLGGTALRLGHGLQRFSEDLIFDAEGLSLSTWKRVIEETGHRMSGLGLAVECKAGEKGSLLTGDLRFGGFLQAYRLTEDHGEKLRVKVEANRPAYRLTDEPRIVAGFGEMVAVRFASTGLIFAEKILALLGRGLGRDVYDAFFMAGKKWMPDAEVLAAGGAPGPAGKAILAKIQELGPKKLHALSARLEPFLFEPSHADLVARAPELLPPLVEYL
ncbi:MAG: hypothetical protein A2X36_04900 [Elusimicrobia bacterium GWA2_69_24]|nr:MAG: hypothetical protein A2X36_04900 [Elusimicrobia bacterium GWA2_69_24]